MSPDSSCPACSHVHQIQRQLSSTADRDHSYHDAYLGVMSEVPPPKLSIMACWVRGQLDVSLCRSSFHLHHRSVGVQDPYTALQTGLFLVQHVANTVRTPVPISLDRYPSPPGSTNLTPSPRQHQRQTNRQLSRVICGIRVGSIE